MNFKIENNFLDITNYPLIERHLEKMASKGWLISKIILGNIFIYKKIQPEQLDFSISPYEIETAFTRKSKEELEEYQSVCKSVGWNYATKSFNLHIYFKAKGSEAIDIQTDQEEEFKTLEGIGEKQIKGYYFQIPFMVFLSWMIVGSSTSSVHSMKDGSNQIVALIVSIALITVIFSLFHVKKFLKTNRKNIEIGKSLEFKDTNFYKITFPLIFIIVFVFLAYTFYVGIFLKNKIILMAFFPVIIGIVVASIYRISIKPSRKSLRYKKIGFFITIIVATYISIYVGIFNINNIINQEDHPDVAGYKVLSINDFIDKDVEEEGSLIQNISILIPRSYEYYSFSREYGWVGTEYSKALTEKLASNLVNRYKKQADSALVGRYSREVELYFEEGIFDDYLLKSGLVMEDLKNLKDKDKKEAEKAARKIINERAIIEDTENPWNADEAYFLNYEKTELVLRKGKEVFYLEGKDFSKVEIIKIIKDQLELN